MRRRFLPLAVALAAFLPLAACIGRPADAPGLAVGDYVTSFYLKDAHGHCLRVTNLGAPGGRVYFRVAADIACAGPKSPASGALSPARR